MPYHVNFDVNVNPPASKASREVANLTERKKSAYPRKWSQRMYPSVRLSVTNFDPNYHRSGKTEQAETCFRTSIDGCRGVDSLGASSLQLWLPELFL